MGCRGEGLRLHIRHERHSSTYKRNYETKILISCKINNLLLHLYYLNIN